MRQETPWYLKACLWIGLPLAVVGGIYLSLPGEIALAEAAGWSEDYSFAMPVCVSVYALVAGAIATYRRKMRLPGQRTALVGAAASLALAMSAQSIAHLIQQDYMGMSGFLVVAVSCVPPLTVFHLVHMAETPSAVLTATEQMDEMEGTIKRLETELKETRKALRQAEKEKEEKANSRKKVDVKVEDWRAAQQRLMDSTGQLPTIKDTCDELKISESTYYRHIQPELQKLRTP
jgi:soluble cytochrome b562